MAIPFLVRDCALASIATGDSASSLTELRELLGRVSLSSIYHHFWGERLRPLFAHPDYHNDFAKWAHFSVHDDILSERLGIIDPTEYESLEDLRDLLIEIIDTRLDETDFIFWTKRDKKFYFVRSVTIIFNTPVSAIHPSELKTVIPTLSTSSVFYHFIDARRRTPNRTDDFSAWLQGFKDEFTPLIQQISLIDPYFLSLTEIKQKLIEAVNHNFP